MKERQCEYISVSLFGFSVRSLTENPYMDMYNVFIWAIRADVVALDSRTRNDSCFTMYLALVVHPHND